MLKNCAKSLLPLARRWQSTSSAAAVTVEMDKIRARGFLRFTYNYTPEPDIEHKIETVARECGLVMDPTDWRTTELAELDKKEKFLLELGRQTGHFVPNSKLHKMKRAEDVVAFYATPTSNITRYAEMARNRDGPKNLAIMEHHRRFHPNDKSAPHGGVPAFPGEYGRVYGLRNQRLHRQFRPKQHWFEYEDVTFDDDAGCSKGMPWDPEIARRMDSYTEVRFAKCTLPMKRPAHETEGNKF